MGIALMGTVLVGTVLMGIVPDEHCSDGDSS